MNYKKVKVQLTLTNQDGVVDVVDVEFEGQVSLTYEQTRPIVPTFTHLGSEAIFKTSGIETLTLNLVNKTIPKVV